MSGLMRPATRGNAPYLGPRDDDERRLLVMGLPRHGPDESANSMKYGQHYN